ncbi:MAG: hypothetical protein EAZ53_13825 [Bacteroidetes bacterium]|nr:MAG: hypothetical protein EAZ53_13825 [Bacteroidota bacterium]
MENDGSILGCFIMYPSLYHDASQEMVINSEKEGILFNSYISGENGISNVIKNLKYEIYGNDLKLALLQFILKPIPYLLQSLKPIESYRSKEKSIGIPIIITDDNFFNKSEEQRFEFLKQSIYQKLELLKEVVKKKKLDTNIDLLISDLRKIY